MNETNQQMGFWQHFGELRIRIIRSFIAIVASFFFCYGFHKQIFQFLRLPFDHAYLMVLDQTPTLIQTGILEAFIVYLKLSLLASIFVASPFVFYQAWKFVAPGLKASEKRHVIPFVLLATTFFVGGALFGYIFVFPKGFAFFLSLTSDQNIQALIRMQDYYRLASWMLLGFGISFEAPLIAMYLVYFGILPRSALISHWRGIIVGIVIFSAIVTPTPDPGTLMMMSLPLICLYGLTIIVTYFFKTKEAQE
ncbi:MAG: twin-arginine translocase subunit TatC [Bdellovibrionales bacterium]|nr:twin-arginine translocase subunit TatC [Bdellovibrionales bacterium]